MSVIYVLKLREGKYYVGETCNLTRRYNEHIGGNGSVWTNRYKPLEVVESTPKTSIFDEDNTVKALMVIHGIDNVRGGSYSTMELSSAMRQVLQMEMTHNRGGCFKCGQVGHFAKDCPGLRRTSVTLIPKREEPTSLNCSIG